MTTLKTLPEDYAMRFTVSSPIALAAATLLLALPSGAAAQALQIRVLSNPRPEFVSGGDVLVAVTFSDRIQAGDVRLSLNGADVSASLRADSGGHSATALVTGLVTGRNALAAAAGGAISTLTVVNHPSVGPVISGPHEQPFLCETEKFTLLSGGVAGAPLDANCSIATRVDSVYKATAGGDLKRLASPATMPSDVVMTTTSLGQRVPFVVRVETGTINRAVYEIAVLFDPTRDAPPASRRRAGRRAARCRFGSVQATAVTPASSPSGIGEGIDHRGAAAGSVPSDSTSRSAA